MPEEEGNSVSGKAREAGLFQLDDLEISTTVGTGQADSQCPVIMQRTPSELQTVLFSFSYVLCVKCSYSLKGQLRLFVSIL